MAQYFNHGCHSAKTEREFYQLTVYHFKDASQEKTIDNYLQNALLPALHKINIKNIGVFKNHSNDTLADKTMYVLMPVRSLEEIIKISSKLNARQRLPGRRCRIP